MKRLRGASLWVVLVVLPMLEIVLAHLSLENGIGRSRQAALHLTKDADKGDRQLLRQETRKEIALSQGEPKPKEKRHTAESLFELTNAGQKADLVAGHNRSGNPMHIELQPAVTPEPLISMPPIVDQYPNTAALAFASIGAVFFGLICLYGYFEDKQLQRRRREARVQAANAAMRPYGMASVPRIAPPRPPSRPAGASTQGVLASAAGSVAGLFTGDVPTMKKHPRDSRLSSSASTLSSDSRTVSWSASSGRSTPQATRHTTAAQVPGIRAGSVLRARVPEVVFASCMSWQEIGELQAGQRVIAAGPPQFVEDYVMIPIQPRGAVDIKVMEIVLDS